MLRHWYREHELCTSSFRSGMNTFLWALDCKEYGRQVGYLLGRDVMADVHDQWQVLVYL